MRLVKNRIRADHEPPDSQFGRIGKDRIEFTIGARVENMEPQPEGVSRRLRVSG